MPKSQIMDFVFAFFLIASLTAFSGFASPLATTATMSPEKITVLNPHSTPRFHDNWTVNFTTTGTADMRIAPAETTSWTVGAGEKTGRDLDFTGIWCGKNAVNYEWINGTAFVPDYSCNETSYGISKTLTTGRHALEFGFGDSLAYAYNSVPFVSINTPAANSYVSGYVPGSPVFEIREMSGSALTDYQVLIRVDTASLISQGKLKDDCSNIGFSLLNGTQLKYWLESGCNTDTTRFWVKLPSIPANSVVYVAPYFADFSLPSTSSGSDVFEFFDGFDGSGVNTTTWTVRNSPTVSSGSVSLTSAGLWATTYTMPAKGILESKFYTSGASAELRVGASDSARSWVSQIGTTGVAFDWSFFNNNNYYIEQTNVGQSARDVWGCSAYRAMFKYDTSQPLYYYLFDSHDSLLQSPYWPTANSPGPNTQLHPVLNAFDTGGILNVDYIFVRKYANREPSVMQAQLNATVILNATSTQTGSMWYYLDNEPQVTVCTGCSSYNGALVPGGSKNNWWNVYWKYRTNITVNTGYMPRKANTVTQTIIDFGSILSSLGDSGTIDQNSIRVVSSNNDMMPSEILRWITPSKAMVRFKLTKNETLARKTNYAYSVYFDTMEHGAKPKMPAVNLPKIYALVTSGAYSYYLGGTGDWDSWNTGGPSARKVAVADFDNDGAYDFVANLGSSVAYYQNTNNEYWSFSAPRTISTHDMYYADLAVCDFNEDGNLDIATEFQNGSWPSTSATHFIVLFGSGNGTFNETYIDQINMPAYYPNRGVCGDFDGDGHMDVIMFHRYCYGTPNARGVVYWGYGNGSFLKQASYVGDARNSGAITGAWVIDSNRDGYDDLYQDRCSSGTTTRTQGPGPSRSWPGAVSNNYLDTGSRSMAIQFDNNNDGLQDLLLVGDATSSMYVAYGTTTGANDFDNPVIISNTASGQTDIGVPEGLRGISASVLNSEKGFDNGTHTVTVYADDGSGNTNYTTNQFAIDLAPPAVKINYPGSATSDSTPLLNFTISEIAPNSTRACIDGACKTITNTNGVTDFVSLNMSFVDSFAYGSAQWTPGSGTWSAGNGEYDSTNATGSAMSRAGPNWNNYDYSLKFRNLSSDGRIMAVFRYISPLNYYYLDADFKRQAVRISNSSGGGVTSWYGYTGYSSPGQWTLARLSINGSNVDVYVNGKYLFSYNSLPVAAGNIGVGTINASAGFDEVSVAQGLPSGTHKVTVYADDIAGNYNASTQVFTVDPSLPKINIALNASPPISPVGGDVSLSGSAGIGGVFMPYAHVSASFGTTPIASGTKTIASGPGGFNYTTGNSGSDNTFSFTYNSTSGNMQKEFIVPSGYIRPHKSYFWFEAENLSYTGGPASWDDTWGGSDPSGAGATKGAMLVSETTQNGDCKCTGYAIFYIYGVPAGTYNLWIRGNAYVLPFYASFQTDNATWEDYRMAGLETTNWAWLGWANKTIAVRDGYPIVIKLNDTSTGSWQRLIFDAALVTDDFSYAPSVQGDNKYGKPYPGYFKINFVYVANRTFDLNLTGNDSSAILGRISDSANNTALQVINNQISMHDVATDQNGNYNFNFNLKGMLGAVAPGNYPVTVNVTDGLNNGSSSASISVRSLIFNSSKVYDSLGGFDDYLNENESYKLAVRLLEYDGTTYYPVLSGNFSMTVNDTAYPMEPKGNGVWATTSVWGNATAYPGTGQIAGVSVSGATGNLISGSIYNQAINYSTAEVSIPFSLSTYDANPNSNISVAASPLLTPPGSAVSGSPVSILVDNYTPRYLSGWNMNPAGDWWNTTWKYRCKITFNETLGIRRTSKPVVLNGSELKENCGNTIYSAKENSIRVLDNNSNEISSTVNDWTDSTKAKLDTSSSTSGWWNATWRYREKITLDTGNYGKIINASVFRRINFSRILQNLGAPGSVDQNSIRLIRSDGEEIPISMAIWYSNSEGLLYFMANGTIDTNTKTDYYLYFDATDAPKPAKSYGVSPPPDVFIQYQAGTIFHGVGNYNGTFTMYTDVLPKPSGTGSYNSQGIADFDNDGDLDYVIGRQGDANIYYARNLGGGNGFQNFAALAAVANAASTSNIMGIGVADFNKDGNMDFVAERDNNVVSVYLGYGNGSFYNNVNLSFPGGIRGMAVGDFDHDGNMDIMRGGNSGSGAWWIDYGDGQGGFIPDTATGYDYGYSNDLYAMAAIDGNQDSWLDHIGGGAYYGSGGTARRAWENTMRQTHNPNRNLYSAFADKNYWTNISQVGSYSDVTGWMAGYDFNHDGIDDLIGNVYADNDASKCGVWYWQGQGKWSFSTGKRLGKGGQCWMMGGAVSPQMGHNLGYTFTEGEAESASAKQISVIDANDEVSFAISMAPFEQKSWWLYYDDVYDVVPGYPAPEAAAVAVDDNGVLYYLGSKNNGKFDDIVSIGSLGSPPLNVRGVAVADFDHDGNLDIVTGIGTGTNAGKMYLFRQTSPGTFAPGVYIGTVSTDMASWLMGVRAGDFDGSGNMGFVAAGNRDDIIALFYGNGDGTFYNSYTSFTPVDSNFKPAIDVGDINNDGFTDIVLATQSGEIFEYLGHGKNADNTWNYTRSDTGRNCGTNPFGLVVGDFNNDGNDDVLCEAGSSGIIRYMQGNGDGTFGPLKPTGINLGTYLSMDNYDFDKDGKQDLIIVNYQGYDILYYSGNGDFTFNYESTQYDFTGVGTLAVSAPPYIPYKYPIVKSIRTGEYITQSDSGGSVNYTFLPQPSPGTHTFSINLLDKNNILGSNSTAFTIEANSTLNASIIPGILPTGIRPGRIDVKAVENATFLADYEQMWDFQDVAPENTSVAIAIWNNESTLVNSAPMTYSGSSSGWEFSYGFNNRTGDYNYTISATTNQTINGLPVISQNFASNFTVWNVTISLEADLSRYFVNPGDEIILSGNTTYHPSGTGVANNTYEVYIYDSRQKQNNITVYGPGSVLNPYGNIITLNASTDIASPSLFWYSLDGERNVTACASCASFRETLMPVYGPGWWNQSWKYRFVVSVDTGKYGRIINESIFKRVNFTNILNSMQAYSKTIDQNSIRVIDQDGNEAQSKIAKWYSANDGLLWFLANGTIETNTVKKFYVYFDTTDAVDAPKPAKTYTVSPPPDVMAWRYANAFGRIISNYDGTFSNFSTNFVSCPSDPQGNGCSWAQGNIAPADFDNDGDLDFVTAAYGYGLGGGGQPHYMWYFQNLGGGNGFQNFAAPVNFTQKPNYLYDMGMDTGDFNKDGCMDFILEEYYNTGQYVYLGNCSGGFTRGQSIYYWSSPRKVDVADFDEDGNLDIMVFFNDGGGSAVVRYGNGDGTFSGGTKVCQLQNYDGGYFDADMYDSAVGDFDNDGYYDIIVGGHQSMGICHGTGPRKWASSVNFCPKLNGKCEHGTLGVKDWDYDGNQDILYVDVSDNVKFFRGNGDGTFGYPVVVAANPGNSYNGDESPTIGKNLGFTVNIEMPDTNISEGEHTIDVYLKNSTGGIRQAEQKFKVYRTRTTFSTFEGTQQEWRQAGQYNNAQMRRGHIELADNTTQATHDLALGAGANTTFSAQSGISLQKQNATDYYPSGSFVSKEIDMGSADPNITYISWNEILPYYGKNYLDAELGQTSDTLFLANFNTGLNADYANGSATAISNGTDIAAGKFGQGAHINGTDYLHFNATGNIDPAKGTIEFWVKPDWNGSDNGTHYYVSPAYPYIWIGSGYRMPIIINGSTSALTNYQVLINLTSSNFDFSKANSQGNDTRFTWLNTTSGLEQNISFWIEKWTSSGSNGNAIIWAKVPGVAASNVANTTLYMYYGSPSAISASNLTATFIREIGGVQGSWSMDEGTGTFTYDTSGNANMGTLVNSPLWTNGKFGKGLQFNGVNNYVDVGNGASLKLSLPITFSMWINIPSGIDGNWRHLISSTFWGGNPGYDTMMNSNQQLIMTVNGGECTSPRPNFGISTDAWHYIVYSVSSSTSNISIDGIPRQTWNGAWSLSGSSYNTWIGYSPAGLYSYFWGVMDDVRIYNRALTASEISDLYNNYGYTTTNYPGRVLVRKYVSPEPAVATIMSPVDVGESIQIYHKDSNLLFNYSDYQNNCGGISAGINWSSGEWHHIAATWDNSTGVIKLFTDGALAGYAENCEMLSKLSDAFYIGTDSAQKYQANATIDDFRISNKPISATDIKMQSRTSPDNSAWSGWQGPDGTNNTYYTSWLENNITSPDARYVQYLALLETSDTNVTPVLKDAIIHSIYRTSGTYVSGTTGISYPVTSVTPAWDSIEPANTSVNISISVDGGATWSHAANNAETRFPYSTQNKYLKYKAFLQTSNTSVSPRLEGIGITYNRETQKTDTGGNYFYSFIAPSTFGKYNLTVKITDPEGFLGTKTVEMGTFVPAIITYSENINYSAGQNSIYGITAYYSRTDTGAGIAGSINITVGSLTKTCSGASACEKQFAIGPSGELRGGNYSIILSAENESQFYDAAGVAFPRQLDEPAAIIQLYAPNYIIPDFTSGQNYTLLLNASIINSQYSSVFGTNISASSPSPKMGSILPINNGCINLTASQSCNEIFSITVLGSANVADPPYTIDWKVNWTNNNGSLSTKAYQSWLDLREYTALNLSLRNISLDKNISKTYSYAVNVSDVGNIDAFNVSAATAHSWITFRPVKTPPYATWRPELSGWDTLAVQDHAALNITVAVDDFRKMNYTDTINITSVDEATGDVVVNEKISLSIIVNPVIAIDASRYESFAHNGTSVFYYIINNTGNAKLVNATISYQQVTLPPSWLGFNSSAGDILEGEYHNSTFNATIPDFQDPGNYTGILRVNASGESEQTNLTINVKEDGTWYFLPSENLTANFSLNQPGLIGNLTVQNNGNIPLNFTIAYIKSGLGSTDCTSINCLTENIVVGAAAYNPPNIYVPKNSSASFGIYINGYSTPQNNVGVGVQFSNASANPSANTAYVFHNIMDMPAVIKQIKFYMFGQESNIVEINYPIEFYAYVEDDAGIRKTEFYFNVSKPGSIANETYYPTYTSCVSLDRKCEFRYTYSGTDITGAYTLYPRALDSFGHETVNASVFNVTDKTALQIKAGAIPHAKKITQSNSENLSVPLNITNLGYTTAYYVNLTVANITQGWAGENKSIGNISLQSSALANLIVFVPAKTSHGTYPVNISVSWRSPSGEIMTNSTQENIIVDSNYTYEITGLAPDPYIVLHGETFQTSFNLNLVGNDNETNFYIEPYNANPDLSVVFSPNYVDRINIGSSANITMNITVKKGAPPGTKTFDIKTTSLHFPQLFIPRTVFTSSSPSWTKSVDNISINGVSGQNAVEGRLNITNTGNIPLAFNFLLGGNLTSFANLFEASKTIGALANYTVWINYTAPEQNAYYEGVLNITDTTGGKTDSVSIHFNSIIARLDVSGVIPSSNIVAGNILNVTAGLTYGSTPVTDNITWSIKVNGTDCPIVSSVKSANVTYLLCNAPGAADGRYQDMIVRADYMGPQGPVTLIKTVQNAVYYKDITPPQIVSKYITTPVEIGNNVSIDLVVTDNVQVSKVIALITYPNGSNLGTMELANTYGSHHEAKISNESLTSVGKYSISYYTNDTANNRNDSASDTFEVYALSGFSGVLVTTGMVPIAATFTLFEPGTQNVEYAFSSNGTGYYNATLKRKRYDLKIDTLGHTILLQDVDFAAMPSDFIAMDSLPKSMLNNMPQSTSGLKGIAVKMNSNAAGNITMRYSDSDLNLCAGGCVEASLKVYRCNDWSYAAGRCMGSWFDKSSGDPNVVLNEVYGTSAALPFIAYNTSAYAILDLQQEAIPKMNLPTAEVQITVNHSAVGTAFVRVESIGTAPLTNIKMACSSGTVCTDFGITTVTVESLSAGYLDMPVNVTVPRYYSPSSGTPYQGVISVASNSFPNEQAGSVLLKVNVLKDESWNFTHTLKNITTGGGNSGTLGLLTMENTGNTQTTVNISSNMPGVTISPNSVVIDKQQIKYADAYYVAPKQEGVYGYSITLYSPVKSSNIAGIFNITHSAAITQAYPDVGIERGMSIGIYANATYLGQEQKDNVDWYAAIGKKPCENLSAEYVGTKWQISCSAPDLTGKLENEMVLQALFFGNESQTAYDNMTVRYKDVFPPVLESYTPEHEKTGGGINVTAVITDDTGVDAGASGVRVKYFTGENSTYRPLIFTGNDTYYFSYNFSETGDYILTYVLQDTKGNSANTSRYFEYFEYVNSFAGNVLKANGSGVAATFTLYRPNQSYSANQTLKQFATDANGEYRLLGTDRPHKRNYDVMIQAFGHVIRLSNLDFGAIPAKFIDVDEIELWKADINDKKLTGIAVRSQINASGSVMLSYDYKSVNNINNLYIHKCDPWDYGNGICKSSWSRIDNTLRSVGNAEISISSFSGFVLAEASPTYAPNTTLSTPNVSQQQPSSQQQSGSSGSSSGASAVDISALQKELGNLKKSVQDLLNKMAPKQDTINLGTQSVSLQLYPGEDTTTSISVKNNADTPLLLTTNVSGSVSEFLFFRTPLATLPPGSDTELKLRVFIPQGTTAGLYLGAILLETNGSSKSVPVDIRVLPTKENLLDMKVQPLTDTVSPGETLRAQVDIYNLGKDKRVDIQLNLQLIDIRTENAVAETEESLAIETSVNTIKSMKVPENISTGRYILKGTSYYTAGANQTMHASSLAYVTVAVPWYEKQVFGIPGWALGAGASFIVLALALNFAYKKRKEKSKKYRELVDIHTLPQANDRSVFLGKLAETGIRTFFPLDRMQTHIVVAGATGGGKSISAQVIAEEALMKGVGVIVLDPTAQWSGFLRKCQDKDMLNNYREFQMNKNQAKAFDGNIIEITDPKTFIDIKKYMTPKEINIFAMNKMTPEQIDIFIANVINQVFLANLEESHTLKQLIVCDEVHRLMQKFGGSGKGFIQVERGCREFRKWGVGMILISQVLSDFVGEIKANIGTEIQVRTRDEGDLERIKTKYGDDIMRSIIKASIGTGLLQNSEFNKGMPYFISFRPILHSTRRLPDSELELYNKYNARIDILINMLEQLKSSGMNVFESELELKLALSKLKKGSFSMVDIYLESLEPQIKDAFNKLGKIPVKQKQAAVVSEDEINRAVEEAKKAREKYVADEEKKKADEAKNKAGKDLESLKNDYNQLLGLLSAKRKKGKDMSLIEARLKAVLGDIQMAEATNNTGDIKKGRDKLNVLKKDIEAL